jgi:hypothetical protein
MKITIDRSTVEQALEALSLALSDVDWRANSPTQPVIHKAHTALKAAQAGPVQLKEHCLWARNGNEPCPHVQQAEPVQEPDLWGAGYEAGYQAGMAERPAEPPKPASLKRGTTGRCTRKVCECEKEGLGLECIHLEPVVDGYPLWSGIPKVEPVQEPVPDRLEQLRAFCKWERVNSPHPDGLPHVAEWAVMEIDRLRAAKAQPVQDTDCHAQGICQRSGYSIK